jgi:transcriptional regulator SbtR-like protein
MASCHDVIRDSLKSLLEPAQRAGAVRADVRLNDLLRLVNGVALAADGSPEGADRLLAPAWRGVGCA